MIEVVGSRDDKQIAVERAASALRSATAKLAANMMRNAAGGGSLELIEQMNEVIRAYHQYRERLLCCDTVTGTQDGPMFEALRSWQPDHFETRKNHPEEARQMMAQDEIAVACLRIIAARLLGQRTQESTAENKFHDGMRHHEEAMQALRAHYRKP
jgi:hypothetical protein